MADTVILTEPEKKLIRETWILMEPQMAAMGSQVFLWIFETVPNLKELFPFKDTPTEDLENHPVFRNHSYR